MKFERAQSVYVMFNPELNITKIGVSDNVEYRKQTLECSCGCHLIVNYSTSPIFEAGKYEKRAHLKLHHKRKLGEWFNVTPEEAIEVVKQVTKKATLDQVAEQFKNGESIASIARAHNVTRQAIIARLRQFGLKDPKIHEEEVRDLFIEEHTRIRNIKDRNKKAVVITENTPEITFLDEEHPECPLTRLKRVEPNISSNGEWYQVSFYVSGQFKYAYTKDLEKARTYRDSRVAA